MYQMDFDENDYAIMFDAVGFDLPKGNKGFVHCPVHDEKTPSMHISLTDGLFHCFGCGYGGWIPKEYYKKTGKRYKQKSEYSSEELNAFIQKKRNPRRIHTTKSSFSATFELSPDTQRLKDWLQYRGIDFRVADKAGAFYGDTKITYKDDEGEEKSYHVRDRVVFPIYDEKHNLLSLEMRFPFMGTEPESFKKNVSKVLYPKRSSVNLLYDSENLLKNKKLYVAEGLMDCLAFRSLTGISNSTSIFGANITTYQKELLNSFPEVCYVYNNDQAGLKSLESMKSSYKGVFTELKPAKDFDDVGEMAMAKFDEVEEWLKTEK